MSVAVILVTRNNPVLLGHVIEKIQKHPAGVDCNFFIVDASSDDSRQLKLLSKQNLGQVLKQDNDRVEVNFDQAYRTIPRHDHYFFMHDDNVPVADNWLKPFVNRISSTFCEPNVLPQYHTMPIGRVGASTQCWRDYTHMAGRRAICHWVRLSTEVLTGHAAPVMFKYADCDRVLISRECLENTDGLMTVANIAKHRDKFSQIFSAWLNYGDVGTYPQDLYPAGYIWNRLTLLSEFLNSVVPLMCGYRTVGVEGNGFIESFDLMKRPVGHRFIAHYGSPNALEALEKCFKVPAKTIKGHFNERVFLGKIYNYFRNIHKEKEL